MTDNCKYCGGKHWSSLCMDKPKEGSMEAKAREAIKRKLGVEPNPELIGLWIEAKREGYKQGYQHGMDTTWKAKNAEGLTPIEAAKKAGMEEAAKVNEARAEIAKDFTYESSCCIARLKEAAAAIRGKIPQ